MELNYTPLSDGFKVAKDDNGNIVFARNDTTLFVASPDDLVTTLTPLVGSIGTAGQAVVDTTTADALTAANAKIAQLQSQLADANTAALAVNDQMAALREQITADKAAAAAIAEAMAKAQTPSPVDAAPSSTEPPVSPTIAPSNTGISGS
ncbi:MULTISPECIES: hypothetical protein [Paraburkholderia]|uniref:hypothetical protein n=1 Tax=Paraburkholderia TaxID=1822464 RepID=UPI00225A5B10|nr:MULTISPECIES: hypothetical protein [Paraburkholderia]MCX4154989.1 hypothetical protein [Paraburkholderia aspalathi]MDN7164399.1 hypothetical protein [Paraburkholderia sp. SECH2]MDQ6392884.1 hypothetical protein [Paraburkholderia aspalathi]